MSETTLPLPVQESIARSRKAFVESVAELRPRLHRFCSRMCGSSLDGEDLVQETLAEAFYTIGSLRDATRFEPWMFRIAHHKCVDFLRRQQRRASAVDFDEHDVNVNAQSDDVAPDLPVDEALATLVGELPPKERATIVLKDVLEYPLTDIAEIVDSTLAGVKAALHRGRTKLRAVDRREVAFAFDDEQRQLFDAYADCFNRRDWAALRDLVSADARLEIVGEAIGRMGGLGSTYSGNYSALPWEWRLSTGVVDGELVIVHSRRTGDVWTPHAAIRLELRDGKIAAIRDYIHIAYLLRDATPNDLMLD